LLCPLRQSRFLEVFRPTAPAAPQSLVSANSRPRTVPPSGFAYPHDGFRRASPGPVCFAGTALLGFSLRRFPLLPIRDASRRPAAHMAFDALVCAANCASHPPAAYWALIPAGVRCRGGTQLSVARARASLGLFPPRGPRPSATTAPSRDLPSRASPAPRRTVAPAAPQGLYRRRPCVSLAGPPPSTRFLCLFAYPRALPREPLRGMSAPDPN
jgi:hypothetical protein